MRPIAFSVAALFFAGCLSAVSSHGQAVDLPHREPFKVDALTGFIHLLNKPDLVYPEDALKGHIEGRVELELTVSAQGDVVSERAVRGPSALRQGAIDAFKKAKYIPFDRDGKPSVALVQAIVAYKEDRAEISTEGEHAISRLPTPVKFGKDVDSSSKGTGDGQTNAGDFGLSMGTHGQQGGNLEILSDTQGVDFSPYLQQVVLPHLRENWYNAIPESAQRKHGKVVIEFAITKDGKVAAMKLVVSSGDILLDRAAWAGIVASDPFPPLPSGFQGPYITLRLRFYYNLTKEELAPAKSTESAPVVK